MYCMAGASGEGKPRIMVSPAGYFYSDVSSSADQNIQTQLLSQLQSFEPNPEIYNMATDSDMLGFSSKNFQQHAETSSCSWMTALPSCGANERPKCKGLSLSLSSSNPSGLSLQSFELKQHDGFRFGPSSSRPSVHIQNHFQIMNSKYLGPAKGLLNEFCNLGRTDSTEKMGVHKASTDENAATRQSLNSLDRLELQKRKTKLLQMLEQLERRYKHYCDQMKAVVTSFEAVAGNGAGTVYAASASRTMSRHFRRLKDGIVSEIKATNRAMGEKDSAAPGTLMKGETPRLRLLDQKLRQQRVQQMNMMESHPWRPQRGLPERSVSVLRAWLFEHFLHPYPSDVDKHILARQTGLSRSQVSNWFINARVRLWKPMVEEMYMEELKDQEGSSVNVDENNWTMQNQNPSRNEDRKPTHDELARNDSEYLSSIISDPEKNDGRRNKAIIQNEPSFDRVGESFGAMELDFSSYTHHAAAAAATGVGGVSLTLGLNQQMPNSGMGLPFATASQSSIFFPRDQIQDCPTVQYSLLDSENQTLPYRNLMGAQLLRDLGG